MSECLSKKWYRSKGIWLGIIAIIGSLLQMHFGLIIDGPTQGLILGFIAIIIRCVTKEEVEWK